MNKKAFLTASVCLLLGGINKTLANPPSGGSNFQTISAASAQAYINNYKTTVQNKFAEFYSLDLTPVNAMVANGAAAFRLYNGVMGETNKVAIMVPVDANYNNNTNVAQMPAMSGVWVCPPNCDITKTGAAASMMNTANAKIAANTAMNSNNYDNFNAFIVYPAALNSLKTTGAVSFQVCHAINTETGGRCIIYRGVTATGSATYFVEDASNMCNRCTL